MDNDALWREVGLELARIRIRQGYSSTYNVYTRHRDTKPEAPAYNTLNDIEAGRPGYVDSVAAYCKVLGVEFTDVLRNVLGMGPGVDSDALRVAHFFQDERTDPALRAGILAIVGLQERATGSRGRSPATPEVPPSAPVEPPRRVPPAGRLGRALPKAKKKA